MATRFPITWYCSLRALKEVCKAVLDKTPDTQALTAILGEELYPVWEKLCRCIDVKYDMDQL